MKQCWIQYDKKVFSQTSLQTWTPVVESWVLFLFSSRTVLLCNMLEKKTKTERYRSYHLAEVKLLRKFLTANHKDKNCALVADLETLIPALDPTRNYTKYGNKISLMGGCLKTFLRQCQSTGNQHCYPLKGQCHEFFCFWFFSWISFPQASDYTIRAVSNFFENSRRYSQLKVCHRCQRHRWQMEKIFNLKNFNNLFCHLWVVEETYI